MKVLDTDHCVALLRGRIDLRSHTSAADELAVTTISIGELVRGAFKSERSSHNLSLIEAMLALFEILPFDEQSARQFGILKAQLERHGTPVSNLDLQIVSTALARHAPLVTHNRRHFECIPNLVLEDWLA